MKNRLLTLLLVAALLLAAGSALSGIAEAANDDGYGSMTVMVYLCGNDLESGGGYFASEDIMEIINAEYDSDQVNVLVATGGAKAWGIPAIPSDAVTFWRLWSQDENVSREMELSGANMGDPDTLSRFVNYAMTNYPADRYGLVMWNHGGGPIAGLCFDEVMDGDGLTLPELRDALEATPLGQDKKLSFLGLSVCLLGTAESASVSAPFADYLIASEESMYYPDFDFAFLSSVTSLDDRELAEAIAKGYVSGLKADNPVIYSAADISVSVIDLSKMADVETALNDLVQALPQISDTNALIAAFQLREALHGFGGDSASYFDVVDLKDLAQTYAASAPEEAERLTGAIEEAVVYKDANFDGANGLSVYFPYNNLDLYMVYAKTFSSIGFAESYHDFVSGLSNSVLSMYIDAGMITAEEVAEYSDGALTAFAAAPVASLTDGFTAEVADDGTITAELPLDDEQLKYVASAQLELAEADKFVSFNGYFPFDYTDVEVGEGGIRLTYAPKRLVVEDASGAELGRVLYSKREGYYFIPVTQNQVLMQTKLDWIQANFEAELNGETYEEEQPVDDMEYGWLVAREAEDGQTLQVVKVLRRDDALFPDDSKLHTPVSDLMLDGERFPVLSFNLFGLAPTYSAAGQLRPMDTWAADQDDSDGSIGLIEVDNTQPWTLRFVSADERTINDRYVQLVVTDVFGQRHASDLVRLDNPCRPCRAQLDETLYADDDGVSLTVKEVSLVKDDSYSGIWLTIEETNPGEPEHMGYELIDMRVNGESVNFTYSSWDDAGEEQIEYLDTSDWSETTLPGTWEEPIYIRDIGLPESVGDRVTSISFGLAVYTADETWQRTYLLGEDDPDSLGSRSGKDVTLNVDLDLSLLK